MQSVKVTTYEATPEWLNLKLEFLKKKIELQIKVSDIESITLDESEDILIQEVSPLQIEETPEERKRRQAKEYSEKYYAANKERLREAARNRYRAKKTQVEEEIHDIPDNASELSEESLVFDYDPSIIPTAEVREYRDNYYQNHLAEIRQYYQDNKDRIAKRQQTDESRAKYREQYKSRREKLTPAQIGAKNAISTAQRKVREAKLRAKYPGIRLNAAKALEKAARQGM